VKKALITLCVALIGLSTLSGAATAAPKMTAELALEWAEPQLDGFYQTMFALQGQEYHAPKVTYHDPEDTVYTGCGTYTGLGLAFYCPADEQIIIGTDLIEKYGTKDEFIPVYILAHEWAHHAQNLSGTAPEYDPAEGDWNQVFNIENELRADCMSGVWMRNVAERGYLDATDMSHVLVTASEIGGFGMYGRGASHGLGVERLRALFLGYEDGMMACMAITPMER
jgi:predicted metalloprotease